jgi:hypothetical protein
MGQTQKMECDPHMATLPLRADELMDGWYCRSVPMADIAAEQNSGSSPVFNKGGALLYQLPVIRTRVPNREVR